MPVSSNISRRWRKTGTHRLENNASAPVIDTKSSHFPIDIVQIILDFLSTDLENELRHFTSDPDSVWSSLLSLSLVARAWRGPAQRALFTKLSPTSYRAAVLLVKVLSRESRLANCARTISSPSFRKTSKYDCNEIIDLFQRLWLCCPNIIAIAIPLHPRYFITGTPATNILWVRGSTLTHLVVYPSTAKKGIWEKVGAVQGPTIELTSLNRLTLNELRNKLEVNFLKRLLLPKLKQLDLVRCTLDHKAIEHIWNSPTLERLSLKFSFFDDMILGSASLVPNRNASPPLSILTDHWFLHNNPHEHFDSIVALHIHSQTSFMEMNFVDKYFPQLEVLHYTFKSISHTQDIDSLARFIKEKNIRAPRLATFHITMLWIGYEMLDPPLEIPTPQLLLVLAYYLHHRCSTYQVSFGAHIASLVELGYGIFEIMPDFPSRRQPWSHKHWSITRLMHNASHRRIPLWGGRKLPPLASLWS